MPYTDILDIIMELDNIFPLTNYTQFLLPTFPFTLVKMTGANFKA